MDSHRVTLVKMLRKWKRGTRL